MTQDDKPLSDLVAQGWDILGFSHSTNEKTGQSEHAVLLRRQRQHKILKIRRKMLGGGIVVQELDI